MTQLQEVKTFQIDVDQVFLNKFPKFSRLIPGFFRNWLKRLMHQDEINRTMMAGKDMKDEEFVRFCFQEIGSSFDSKGLEHIPLEGGAVVAANHPLGASDGMALIAESRKVRKDAKFIVNDILMALPQFADSFLPVNRHGSTTRENLQRVEDTFSNGTLVLIFPAGMCSRKQNGKIYDLEWNKGFISKAIKYNLPVIPAHISGRNTNRFYNIARLRKFLGIKGNLEFLLLPDEMFRQKGKNLRITYGKPIPPSTFDKRHSQKDWANLVRDFTYEVGKDKFADFETFIASRNGN